jgi:hypothetical protein
MEAYATAADAAVFARSRERFESVIAMLSGPATGEQTHAELEEHLITASRELFRTLFQDHLDLRAAREKRAEAITGVDGIRRHRVERGHRRGLTCVFGQVTVERLAYRAPGHPNVYPADAVLNLPKRAHSHGLRRLAALEATRGSFADAAAAIERACGAKMGKRQVEELVRAAAVDVDGFYETRRPAPGAAEDLVVLSLDGKGVAMRPDALRPATAQAAAGARTKLATRLSRGEKRGRKRMAEIGTVYDAVPVPRTPEQIITGPAGPKPQPGPKARDKWLIASIEQDLVSVVERVFDQADRRDPKQERTWVVLVDGNNQQIEAIEAYARLHGWTITLVVDFVHVLEYVWKAAWCFFPEGDTRAEAWVAEHARRVLSGGSSVVAGAIRRTATRRHLAGDVRKRVDACANYLIRKRPYLNYPHALEHGWPIATGVIEGACRHLVKDRLDLTGARWGLSGAEAILGLRAVVANGDFEEYWAFHLRQEHRRVHAARYQGDYTLAA